MQGKCIVETVKLFLDKPELEQVLSIMHRQHKMHCSNNNIIPVLSRSKDIK